MTFFRPAGSGSALGGSKRVTAIDYLINDETSDAVSSTQNFDGASASPWIGTLVIGPISSGRTARGVKDTGTLADQAAANSYSAARCGADSLMSR
jgi:hypothetical protein